MLKITYLVPKKLWGGLLRRGTNYVARGVGNTYDRMALGAIGKKAGKKVDESIIKEMGNASHELTSANRGLRLTANDAKALKESVMADRQKDMTSIYDRMIANNRSEKFARNAQNAHNRKMQGHWASELNSAKTLIEDELTKEQGIQGAALNRSLAARQAFADARLSNARRMFGKRLGYGALGLGTIGAIGFGMMPGEQSSLEVHLGYYKDPEQGWLYDGQPIEAGSMDYDRYGNYNYYDGNDWIQEGNYRLLGDGSIVDKASGRVLLQAQGNGNYFWNNMQQFGFNSTDEVKLLQRQLGVKDDGLFGRQTLAALQQLYPQYFV